jgi:hypothetical protein
MQRQYLDKRTMPWLHVWLAEQNVIPESLPNNAYYRF